MPHQTNVIRDRAINQGIGTSPLVGQAIQRRDIEQNRSLSRSLATSRGILQQQREQRQAQFAGQVLKRRGELSRQLTSRTGISRGVGGGVSRQVGGTASPSLSIEIAQQTGLPGNVRDFFFVRGLGNDRTFGSSAALREFLQTLSPEITRDIAVSGAGATISQSFTNLQADLGPAGASLRRVAPEEFAATIQRGRAFTTAVGRTPALSRFDITRPLFSRRTGQQIAKGQAPSGAIERPQNPRDLLALSIQPNQTLQRNERARVVSAGVTSAIGSANRSTATAEDVGFRLRLLNAVKLGRGFELLQQAAKLGRFF